jgi:hypothetical protein
MTINPKAFEVLNAMRAAVRNDPRPRFADCEIPELGPCRFRRYQPEVQMVLSAELGVLGITAIGQIRDLGSNQQLRGQCVRMLQRAISPLDRSSLLAPGDEGYARIAAALTDDRLETLSRELVAFQEML